MGNKFIKPKFIDKIAIKKIMEENPLSKLEPEILAIPIGPKISFFNIKANKVSTFKPLKSNVIESNKPN